MFEIDEKNPTWVDLLCLYVNKTIEKDKIIQDWAESGNLAEMYKGESYSLESEEDKEQVLQDILGEKGYKYFIEQFPGDFTNFDTQLLITNNQEKIFHKVKTSFVKNLAAKYKTTWTDDLSAADRSEFIGTEWSDYKDNFLNAWERLLRHYEKNDLADNLCLDYRVSKNGQNYYNLSPNDIKNLDREIFDQVDRDIVRNHAAELIDFPETQNLDEYNRAMADLCRIYPFTDEDKTLLGHWLTQTKRAILGKTRQYPMMLCLFSPKQGTGKSWLAYWIGDVINKKRCVFSFEDLTARFKPLEIASEAVIIIDEIGSLNKDKSDAIKSLITAEGKISIERKYRDSKDFNPKANYILTSNRDPSELFYFDTDNRRLAIIEFPQFEEKSDEENTKEIIKRLWDNTPVEYTDAPEDTVELAKTFSLNDDTFEMIYYAWEATKLCYADAGHSSRADDFVNKFWTVLGMKRFIDYCNQPDLISKAKLQNYVDVREEFFEKRKYASANKIKNTQYKMKPAFVEALKNYHEERCKEETQVFHSTSVLPDGAKVDTENTRTIKTNLDSTIPSKLSGAPVDPKGIEEFFTKHPGLLS